MENKCNQLDCIANGGGYCIYFLEGAAQQWELFGTEDCKTTTNLMVSIGSEDS